MGCANSRLFSMKHESTADVPLHTRLPGTARKHTSGSLWDLVDDGEFQAQVAERAFQIFLHEDLPDYWKLQFDLLLIFKSVFDRIKPRSATVIFPNRPLRYPARDTEALLRLTSIKSLQEGVQIWTQYLVHSGSLHVGEEDWHTAFKQTREGYCFNLTP
ncbi:unnamed protein product, partial [Alternaria alternata]